MLSKIGLEHFYLVPFTTCEISVIQYNFAHITYELYASPLID